MAGNKPKEKCTGCGACAQHCPTESIVMKRDEEGFLYPVADPERCAACGLCEEICPVDRQKAEYIMPHAYAARNKDAALCRSSSSGGIFSALAESVIRRGGIVYGSALDGSFSARHESAETLEELEKLRGSKYLQSETGRTFVEVKEQLKTGITVLLSGTPCQIAGLKAYLGEDPGQLYLVDVACHGVPSPSVWERYLQKRCEEARAEAAAVSFRDKTTGWKDYSLRIGFRTSEAYIRKHDKDPYMKVFLRNYSLRPSCYACPAKGSAAVSDITLADMWGAEQICPSLKTDEGLSLVLVNSEKGRLLWEDAADHTDRLEVPAKDALQHNPALFVSAVRPDDRDVFMKAVRENKPILPLLKQYEDRSLPERVLRKLKHLLGRQ